jgi:Pyruvate/2-oxoacid:ferredoxin oxidoreductase delta subunit
MARKPILGLHLPSTRSFTEEARQIKGFSFNDWLHGFVYIHWPYLYISAGTGEHPLTSVLSLVGRLFSPHKNSENGSTNVADGYHGKVVTLEAATQLVNVQQDINLGDLEHIIPYERARDIVLKNPDHIVVLECPCRAARSEPCQPLDVCLIIGEPFASMVAEHHPNRSRWISSQEAANILRAEQERGHVHHTFFKDAMLERFYAICNCCACCCGAMQITRNGDPMLCSSGYVAFTNAEKCSGCGTCREYCQFQAIALAEEGYSLVDWEACMGCGVCVSHCPDGAITLLRDTRKGEPLIIEDLMQAIS